MKRAASIVFLSAIAGVVAACGALGDDMVIGFDCDNGFCPPGVFTPDEAGVDASVAGPDGALCIGTECPKGLGTCLSGPTGPAAYKCGTDLMRDNDNCGVCGNACLTYLPLNTLSRCIDGACQFQCFQQSTYENDWRDCNKTIDDGCEIDVSLDENNCGACGKVCPTGTSCIQGTCGCLDGRIECKRFGNVSCFDPRNDIFNCGACGYSCFQHPGPDQCAVPPAHARYGCVESTCGHLQCYSGWADCNGDIPLLGCASDGCEANLASPDNCGGCGVKCNAGETCITEQDTGNIYCGIPCGKDGLSACGRSCVDLLTDLDSCGVCENKCPVSGPNRERRCERGICVFECQPGFADCNGDPLDGCEVNLRSHPKNCGACGHECSFEAGQPCIEGTCLMVDCSSPGARK